MCNHSQDVGSRRYVCRVCGDLTTKCQAQTPQDQEMVVWKMRNSQGPNRDVIKNYLDLARVTAYEGAGKATYPVSLMRKLLEPKR